MNRVAPKRIVCLTEETTEFLYLLGEEHRIVGISAYTCRPERAKADKPVVSAFTGGSVKKIKALDPDLVIGFSDVQANLARELIMENLSVWITNQRTVEDILSTLFLLGRLVGAEEKATALIDSYRSRINHIRAEQEELYRPSVYFEEWDDPMISAIHWVSELIEIAGGRNVFRDRAPGLASKERTVTFDEVVDRSPEIFIGCWCGKPVELERVVSRPGFDSLPAVQHEQLHEMDPAIILQPGPASLTDGLDELCRIIEQGRSMACQVHM